MIPENSVSDTEFLNAYFVCPFAFIAARTFSGVSGIVDNRMPTALYTALAMAGAVGTMAGSATPRAP